MTVVHALILASLLVNLCATAPYIWNTYHGITRPNRTTWFMWALAPLVASAIAYSAGADPWITSPVFLSGFLPLIVFIISFANKSAYWRLQWFDWLCGALSFAAFFIWLFVNSAAVAIIF